MKQLSPSKALLVASLVFSSVFCWQFLSSQQASAAYDGGNLIDDLTFLDAQSLNATQIQSFLASKGGQIANKSFILNCDAAGQQAKQAYLSLGAPCDQTIPASQIIYYASRVYGVNPKVTLATLQKEQSLITAPNPTDRQYAQAMGYGCPTSGSCNDSSNFFWQVDNGIWVLRFHFERARGNMNWWYTSASWTCGTAKSLYTPNLYPGQNVNFYDTNGVYYRTHFIANAATSALYCYTPHTFNNHRNGTGPPQNVPAGTLCYSVHPESGTSGQCYTGSYNFVKFYELWFGSTQANDTFVAHPNGTLINQSGYVYFIESDTKRYVSPWAFITNRFDWSKVKLATTGDRALSVGGPMPDLAPGSLFYSDNTPLYVMEYEGGVLKKRHVTQEAYTRLGYSWNEVLYVPAQVVPAQTHSSPTYGDRHASGDLIVDSQGRVYFIDNETLRYVTSSVFQSYSYPWSKVKTATQQDLALSVGQPLDFRRGAVYLAGGNIYIIDMDGSGSLKRPVGPWECFSNRWHYSSIDWIVVNPNELPARTGSLFTC